MFRKILRSLKQGKKFPILLGLLVTLFIAWLKFSPPAAVASLVERMEFLIYDLRLEVMPKTQKAEENRIVIVDLDERSLQAEGQYPWNRIKVGNLVAKLRDLGAVVVGFDITFPEPDRSIRDLLAPIDLSQLGSSFNETLEAIEPQIDADRYFASVMETLDVVLAINFNVTNDVSYNELPPSLFEVTAEEASRLTLNDMSGFTGNYKVLQDATTGEFGGSGSMNQLPDADGIVRRVPLVIRYGNQLFPTLSLEMVRAFNFAQGYELITETIGDRDIVTGVQIGRGQGTFVIPTDRRAQVLVPYAGGSSLNTNEHYPYVSATDVLNDRADPALFENALVLVGASAPGLLDLRVTPLDQVYPGVEVHANMLNAILSSEQVAVVGGEETDSASALSSLSGAENRVFPFRPFDEAGIIVLLILLLGGLLSVLFPYLGATSLTLGGFSVMALLVWVNFQMWAVYNMDFTLVLPVLLILLLTMANLLYGFLNESQTRRTIKGMFDQYVPPAHIDSMLENPDNYSFEGESKELTVLFSDIRSFTSISEALTATQLKTLLNEFFTPITGIIFDYHGTIDKYVGDMVMAFWGAPIDDEHHKAHAVEAALAMLEKVEELKVEFEKKGLPEVNIGIGVNTGMMNVGDMGSTYRRSYTVLGDAVNLGSRLESSTKKYGVKLLIGEETVKDLEGFLLRQIDRVKVVGKVEAIQCYEPLCRESEATDVLRERVDAYHKALELYYDQNWDEATARFQRLREAEPQTLLYQVYLGRIELLRQDPPGADWDGSFTHTEK